MLKLVLSPGVRPLRTDSLRRLSVSLVGPPREPFIRVSKNLFVVESPLPSTDVSRFVVRTVEFMDLKLLEISGPPNAAAALLDLGTLLNEQVRGYAGDSPYQGAPTRPAHLFGCVLNPGCLLVVDQQQHRDGNQQDDWEQHLKQVRPDTKLGLADAARVWPGAIPEYCEDILVINTSIPEPVAAYLEGRVTGFSASLAAAK